MIVEEFNDISDFFITSDTWFGREAILSISNRKFNSIDDMNKHIIKQWNSVVKKDDVVVHLGNFAWDPDTLQKIVKKLNGKIFLVLSLTDFEMYEELIELPNVYVIETPLAILPTHDVVLSHWPLLDWPGRETGTIQIHGHSVYNHPSNFQYDFRINACTNHWKYTPIKLSSLKYTINEATK